MLFILADRIDGNPQPDFMLGIDVDPDFLIDIGPCRFAKCLPYLGISPIISDMGLVWVTFIFALRVMPKRYADHHCVSPALGLLHQRLGFFLGHMLQHITQEADIKMLIRIQFTHISNMKAWIQVFQAIFFDVWLPDFHPSPLKLWEHLGIGSLPTPNIQSCFRNRYTG